MPHIDARPRGRAQYRRQSIGLYAREAGDDLIAWRALLGLAAAASLLAAAPAPGQLSTGTRLPHHPLLARLSLDEFVAQIDNREEQAIADAYGTIIVTEALGRIEGREELRTFLEAMNAVEGHADRERLQIYRMLRISEDRYFPLYVVLLRRMRWFPAHAGEPGMFEAQPARYEEEFRTWLVQFRSSDIATFREAPELYVLASEEAATRIQHFVGGSYDQLRYAYVERGDQPFVGFLLPAETASPPDAATAALVAGLIAAQAAGDRAAFARLVAPGARSWMAEPPYAGSAIDPQARRGVRSTPFALFPFAGALTARPPFLTPDGLVRLEWMQGDRLAYLTWLSIAGGKVQSALTRRAVTPRMLRLPLPPRDRRR